MTETVEIKLTPLEPYFFGGERIFEIGDDNKHYFIRSLDEPSQTTLFGALRYIGVENPSKDFKLSSETKLNIGNKSFNLLHDCGEEKQDFGRIKKISPLYLMDDSGKLLIRTPFDDNLDYKEEGSHRHYFPFSKSNDSILTLRGSRYFPEDYNSKIGIANSWMSIVDGTIYSDLFKGITQIGINKYGDENAFFKKEYKQLKKGYSFIFFAELEDFTAYNTDIVYLGQGKSAFKVEWIKKDNEKNKKDFEERQSKLDNLFKCHEGKFAYAQSDIYYNINKDDKEKNKDENLTKSLDFSFIQTRDFRVFSTEYNNNRHYFEKKKYAVKLIRAGSIFWFSDNDQVESFKKSVQNAQAEIAGFNKIIVRGNKNGK